MKCKCETNMDVGIRSGRIVTYQCSNCDRVLIANHLKKQFAWFLPEDKGLVPGLIENMNSLVTMMLEADKNTAHEMMGDKFQEIISSEVFTTLAGNVRRLIDEQIV